MGAVLFLQFRHIYDFVKKRYFSWTCILQECQMLLPNLGSIPGVGFTYLTFKANTNICFKFGIHLYFKPLIIIFCQYGHCQWCYYEHGNSVGRFGYCIDKEGYFFDKIGTYTKVWRKFSLIYSDYKHFKYCISNRRLFIIKEIFTASKHSNCIDT